jgi:hypothetical protein
MKAVAFRERTSVVALGIMAEAPRHRVVRDGLNAAPLWSVEPVVLVFSD